MLTKVSRDNCNYGTENIIKFSKTNKNYNIIMDNMEGYLLIKDNNSIYLWNYYCNKKIKSNRIRINFNNRYFWKQIDSFDQNNISISTKIRMCVLNYLGINNNFNILGIGGEYYMYFPFIDSSLYYGISNHKSIIEDSEYNFKKSINFLVDYNNIKTYPNLEGKFNVIVNVVNLHKNIIEYLNTLNVNSIIVVICKPLYKKINLIEKYFYVKKLSHFLNINNYVTVVLLNRKNIIPI